MIHTDTGGKHKVKEDEDGPRPKDEDMHGSPWWRTDPWQGRITDLFSWHGGETQ